MSNVNVSEEMVRRIDSASAARGRKPNADTVRHALSLLAQLPPGLAYTLAVERDGAIEVAISRPGTIVSVTVSDDPVDVYEVAIETRATGHVTEFAFCEPEHVVECLERSGV
jgi:hypothetical protein